MANHDRRWARWRATVAAWRRSPWLRSPRLWRGLLLVGLLGGAFTWAVVVLGIALVMAQEGTEQWWLVLIFGGFVLTVALVGAYLGFGRGVRSPTTGSAKAAGRAATGANTAEAAAAPKVPEGRTATEPTLSASATSSAAGPSFEPLSQRELEVLQLLATGRSNREIAAELYVATGTVKAHLNNIFRKLEARSRLEAVTRARELRLLGERDPK
jgi:DNA-binding CsgD family transcriptional regulator